MSKLNGSEELVTKEDSSFILTNGRRVYNACS